MKFESFTLQIICLMKSLNIKLIVIIFVAIQSSISIYAASIKQSPPVMTAPGNALAFDGMNDMVDLGNSASVRLTQGTIEAWIKTPNAGDSYRGIVVKQWAYSLFLFNNELIAFCWDGSNNVSTGVYLNDNEWHHVALSFNSGVANGTSIYIDGVKKRTFTYNINHQGVGLGIGNGSTDTKIQIFNGSIDEVRIWNVARTESQINSTMYNELAGNESGLLAYYNLNQGTAGGNNSAISTVTDKTSNGLNGTLSNFSKTGSSSNFVQSHAMVVPFILSVTNVGGYGFTANWTAPLNGTIDSYKLDVSTSASFNSFVSGYNGLDCGSSLSQTVSGLSIGTTYYYRVRADVLNLSTFRYAKGIVNTLSTPTLSTTALIKLSSSSVSTGGAITSDGGSAVTERGICWGTTPTPTINNNKVAVGSGTGSFNTTVSGLPESEICYIRAYATSALGTAYGNEIVFISGLNIQTNVISISSNSTVTSGGYISAPNGVQVTESGVCWSTSSSPTITDAHSSHGTGTGEFTSNLTGLQDNTKYYVRAYATINQITFYGNEFSFTQKFDNYKFSGGYFDGEIHSGASFEFDGNCWGFIGYIYSCDGGNPPLSGWDDGSELIPIITPKPTIAYDKSSLKEAACNDGSINEIITITHDNLDGATFTGTNNEDFVATGKAIVRNLPAGLTAKIIRTNSLILTLSITGDATSHANAHDVSNVKIMFVPDAFTDGSSVVTNGNVTSLSLNFIEPVDMTVTGTKSCADVTITADNNVTLDKNSTLTINSVTSANQITINPGAKLNLSNTVTVNDIVLKADDSESFSAKLGSCMTVNGTLTFEKTMLDSKWYFLSFPCDVNVSDISMVGGGTLDTDFFILTYDGANRAINGAVNNWSHVTSGTLTAKIGYAYGLKTGLGTKILSFALNKTIAECETDATVPTTFYDGSLGANHKGWNLIGQPYISKFAGSNVGINYLTTWNGSTYVGKAKNLVSSINPFEAFFVQVGSTAPISFALSGRQAVRSVVQQDLQQSLQLNMTNVSGTDFSTLIFDNELSSDYEIGQDLEKWITTTIAKPQIYTVLNNVKYAYNALPIGNATNLPIGYFSKAGGASTISASNVNVAGLSKLILADNKTGASTDLLSESYSFTADAGTNNSRFSIIPQRISTATEEQSVDRKPVVSVVGSKVIISNLSTNAVIRIYDATGKQLLVTKANETNRFETELSVAGMYIVRVDVDLLKNYFKFAIK
jgi:hypothetical protein